MMRLNPFNPPNQYTEVLAGQCELLEALIERGAFASPAMDALLGNMNLSAKETFHITQSVVTPAPAANAFTVLTLDLERGMAALILAIAHQYYGSGFVQSSGAILWDLIVDYRFAPNYSNMSETYGDPQQPRPLLKGIPVGPGQNITYKATIPLLSPITTGGTTRISCTIAGVKFTVK